MVIFGATPLSVSRMPDRRTFLSKARVYEAWITGPSAIGSLYGMPTSHRWQPRSENSRSRSAVNSTSGSPAVINGMNAFWPSARRRWNNWSIEDISARVVKGNRRTGWGSNRNRGWRPGMGSPHAGSLTPGGQLRPPGGDTLPHLTQGGAERAGQFRQP